MVMSRRITCLRRIRTIETHRARIGVVVHIQYDVLPLCSVPLTALGRSIRHACAQQSWLCRRPCVSHYARQCHKLQYCPSQVFYVITDIVNADLLLKVKCGFLCVSKTYGQISIERSRDYMTL